MQATQTHIRRLPEVREESEKDLQESLLSRWFMPHSGIKTMAAQESKGVFVQWPLLILIITLASILIGAIVGLQVQVSNLNTTLLLRDQDHSREVTDLKTDMQVIRERNDLLAMYIQDDREKLAVIKTKLGLPLK